MSFANTFRASLLALGMGMGLGTMSGCGETNPYGDSGIPPLDNPDGNDTTLPDTPLNRFNRCFPTNMSLEILLDGRGAAWGSPVQTRDGGSVLAIDRASLSLLSGTPDAGAGSNAFTAEARWASAPLELYTQNPGDPGYGLMATRTQARANGEPLTNLRRSGMTGSWAEQFPGFTDGAQLGFIWLIEGDFTPSNCQTRLRLRGAVRQPSQGITGPQDFISVPLYSPRPDGYTRLASSTFGNEGLAVLNDAEADGLQMTFNFPSGDPSLGRTSDPALICENNCDPAAGSGLQRLEARLVVAPLSDDAGPGDAGAADGGADARGPDAGSDGGIPPIPPPDGGSGG